MRLRRLIKIVSAYKLFWTLCGVLLAVQIFLYTGPIQKQETEMAQLQARYFDLRSKSDSMQQPGSGVGYYLQAMTAWSLFQQKLPVMSEVSDTARELRYLLEKERVDVGAMTFKPEWVKELDLWRYTTAVTISGPYENVRKALAHIQNAPNLFCVESFSMKQGSGDGRVELRLVIATYCRASEG